jgi:hypothetical protein
MSLSGEGLLLRIYIGESDRFEGRPLVSALIERARREGLAGATAIRGLEGFGKHSLIHSANILRLSSDLPVLIEIADTEEKIEAFLPIVERMVPEGMATLEKVRILFYRTHREDAG